MIEAKFQGTVKNGKVVWSNPAAAREYFAAIEGQRITITMSDPKRTLDQNAAFHALCKEASDYTGDTPANFKDLWKREFLSDPTRSTADLTTDEMSGLLAYASCWYAEHIEAGRGHRGAAA